MSSEYRLMAIDDDPTVLDACRSMFPVKSAALDRILNLLGEEKREEEEGEDIPLEFQLDCFLSGQEGVEALRQSLEEGVPYAVIFLDMRMPNGWSGLETAVKIRKLDQNVRIVLVSAYTDYSLKEIRDQIGPRFVFYSKPWNDPELEQLTRLLVSDWEYEQELQLTQHQLQETKDEVVAANQAKDQFLASMSHELRTPLAALLGYGELLEETPLQQDQQALLQTMQVSGSSLLYLLNDILDLSKIESGKFEVDHVPYSLVGTVKEVAQIFAVKAETAGLQFTVETSQEDVAFTHQLIGDGKRLAQVLINLVSNAIKFTARGEVQLSVYSEGDRLHCCVRDSGIGMAPEVLSRLFKPFQQADSSISGRFGGTGLGLHISKTLVELMGGEIAVESEAGRGSQFDVVIPLLLGEPVQPEAGPFIEMKAQATLKGRVLVAEDVPELQVLVRRMVEATGAIAEVVDDGEQALSRATATSFDLILMDMQMPVMGGIEATQALRAQGNQTPVVALTANAMPAHKRQFKEAGCSEFLTKPIDKASLESVLANYLQQSAAQVAPVEGMSDALMDIFHRGMTERKQELIEASSSRDWKRVSELAHQVKGSAASFGFLQLGELGDQVCAAYSEGEQEQTAKLAMSLIMEISAVLP